MSAVQWFSGPPPAVGWWPASALGLIDFYYWWDGEEWSQYACFDFSPEQAEYRASRRSKNSQNIKWRHWSVKIDGTDGRGAHL